MRRDIIAFLFVPRRLVLFFFLLYALVFYRVLSVCDQVRLAEPRHERVGWDDERVAGPESRSGDSGSNNHV